MQQDSQNQISQMSFEDAMKELERITSLLEKAEIKLDDAILFYEKAQMLQEYCRQKLNEAKMKVEKVLHKNNKIEGKVETEINSES